MDSLHIVLTKSITTAIELTRLVLLKAPKIFPGLKCLQGRLIQMDIKADAQGTFENNPTRCILLHMIIYPEIEVYANCNLTMQNGKEWNLAIIDIIFLDLFKGTIPFRCEIFEDKVQIKHLIEFIR